MLLKYQIQVFEEFLRDFNLGLTGSFIARKKRLNQKTVSNYLIKLEKEHILESKIQGKNKLYFLNKNNMGVVEHFIMAVEHLRTIEFYKKYPLAVEILEKIKPFIKGSAVVFGSYAKGIAKKDSDLDVLIIGRANEKEVNKISKMYGVDVSLKIYPKLKKDILVKEVMKDHIIVKGSEKFFEELMKWIE